jgi:hypothetical protein
MIDRLLALVLSRMARRGRTVGVHSYTGRVPGGFYVKQDQKIVRSFAWDGKSYRRERRG